MHEAFLYYLWQYQYFDKKNLSTSGGEELQIFDPGTRNLDSGPDFLDARIRIGPIEWRGSVELHVNASDWMRHHHATDPAFENVVLHVVWKEDHPITRNDGTSMPTLALSARVEKGLLDKYRKLTLTHIHIPCASMLMRVDGASWKRQLQQSMMHRLEAKSQMILTLLGENRMDWEETCYQLLCRTFGLKVNVEPFFSLARAVPYKVILRHADNLLQVEALLFGTGGFLDRIGKDKYGKLLQREYLHLSRKYRLGERQLLPGAWKFLRLRPANFPTVRIAQAAALLSGRKNLFSRLVGHENGQSLKKLFAVDTSAYWQTHCRFGKPSAGNYGPLGEDTVNGLLINTVAPMLFAYGRSRNEASCINRAFHLLETTAPESNAIIRKWKAIGMIPHSAYDTQALLEQYGQLCLKRRCLDCRAGAALIRPHLLS